jgi:hypothetical protein
VNSFSDAGLKAKGDIMQIIETLVCLIPLTIIVVLFILSELFKRSSFERRARNRELLRSEQKVIQGKASDDATGPYTFS